MVNTLNHKPPPQYTLITQFCQSEAILYIMITHFCPSAQLNHIRGSVLSVHCTSTILRDILFHPKGSVLSVYCTSTILRVTGFLDATFILRASVHHYPPRNLIFCLLYPSLSSDTPGSSRWGRSAHRNDNTYRLLLVAYASLLVVNVVVINFYLSFYYLLVVFFHTFSFRLVY